MRCGLLLVRRLGCVRMRADGGVEILQQPQDGALPPPQASQPGPPASAGAASSGAAKAGSSAGQVAGVPGGSGAREPVYVAQRRASVDSALSCVHRGADSGSKQVRRSFGSDPRLSGDGQRGAVSLDVASSSAASGSGSAQVPLAGQEHGRQSWWQAQEPRRSTSGLLAVVAPPESAGGARSSAAGAVGRAAAGGAVAAIAPPSGAVPSPFHGIAAAVAAGSATVAAAAVERSAQSEAQLARQHGRFLDLGAIQSGWREELQQRRQRLAGWVPQGTAGTSSLAPTRTDTPANPNPNPNHHQRRASGPGVSLSAGSRASDRSNSNISKLATGLTGLTALRSEFQSGSFTRSAQQKPPSWRKRLAKLFFFRKGRDSANGSGAMPADAVLAGRGDPSTGGAQASAPSAGAMSTITASSGSAPAITDMDLIAQRVASREGSLLDRSGLSGASLSQLLDRGGSGSSGSLLARGALGAASAAGSGAGGLARALTAAGGGNWTLSLKVVVAAGTVQARRVVPLVCCSSVRPQD